MDTSECAHIIVVKAQRYQTTQAWTHLLGGWINSASRGKLSGGVVGKRNIIDLILPLLKSLKLIGIILSTRTSMMTWMKAV